MHKTKSRSKFLLFIHIILVVKYRKSLLIKYGEWIKSKITDISHRSKFKIEEMEVDKDHIHLLLEYDPNVSISALVRRIKQITTHDIWLEYDNELSNHFYKKKTFWSPSYFACSIGNASKEIIEKYIKEQG